TLRSVDDPVLDLTGNTEATRHWPERNLVIGIAAKKNHLWFTPMAFPFSAYLEALRQSSAACKAL
ncbi:MAG TPA: hypothetical protein VJX16_12010, partial [Terriglobales bacterium]|nr:hypothetical protein [Terriglobales bacterium]